MKIEKGWDFNTNEQLLGVVLGTLTESSKKQIITYTKSGKILIFSLNGKLLFKDEITQNTPIWKALLYDIDNDGKEELLLGGMDGLLRAFKYNNEFELEPYWTHRFGSSIGGILVDDLNNNGSNEIISYSLDKSLRILNPLDGSLIWGQIFEEGIGDALIWKNSVDSDKIEIIACSNDGTIRSFDNKCGELLWFKRFSDKVRCLSYMHSYQHDYIVCGGDDKKVHIIDKEEKEEIKTIETDDIIWKCLSFPPQRLNSLLVSSYSFEFLDKSTPIKDIKFTSKVMCFNENFGVKWEYKNVNTEILSYIKTFENKCIVIGTTRGYLMLLDEVNGKLLAQINNPSCLNGFGFDTDSKILITCHDDGYIYAFILDKK
ncbi:MAG: WD40 repeat domain-containing protein [Promethearchaeia archaeon]